MRVCLFNLRPYCADATSAKRTRRAGEVDLDRPVRFTEFSCNFSSLSSSLLKDSASWIDLTSVVVSEASATRAYFRISSRLLGSCCNTCCRIDSRSPPSTGDRIYSSSAPALKALRSTSLMYSSKLSVGRWTHVQTSLMPFHLFAALRLNFSVNADLICSIVLPSGNIW